MWLYNPVRARREAAFQYACRAPLSATNTYFIVVGISMDVVMMRGLVLFKWDSNSVLRRTE